MGPRRGAWFAPWPDVAAARRGEPSEGAGSSSPRGRGPTYRACARVRRLGNRWYGRVQLRPARPRPRGHPARRLLRRPEVAVGNRQEAHADLLDVRVWVALGDGRVEDLGPPIGVDCVVDECLHRHLTGELPHDVDDERGRLQPLDRPDLTPDGLDDQLRCLLAARLAVQVRVRAPHHADGRVLHDGLRQVGVHVEGDADGHLRADDLPDGAAELAVHVRVVFGDRGAVVGDEHGLPRTLLSQHGEHLPRQALVGVLRDRPHGPGAGPHQRHGLDPQLLARVEVSGDGVVGLLEAGHDLLPAQNRPALHELVVVGRDLREGVGLVRDAENCEAHLSTSSRASPVDAPT